MASPDATFPAARPRRLRATPAWRRLTQETRVHPAQLILPLFIREGAAESLPIGSMPGVVQHSLDSFRAELVARRGGRHRRRHAVRRARAQGRGRLRGHRP